MFRFVLDGISLLVSGIESRAVHIGGKCSPLSHSPAPEDADPSYVFSSFPVIHQAYTFVYRKLFFSHKLPLVHSSIDHPELIQFLLLLLMVVLSLTLTLCVHATDDRKF